MHRRKANPVIGCLIFLFFIGVLAILLLFPSDVMDALKSLIKSTTW